MARTARAVVSEKQARALTLVRAGHSYDEIAADLGYAYRGSAYRLPQRLPTRILCVEPQANGMKRQK